MDTIKKLVNQIRVKRGFSAFIIIIAATCFLTVLTGLITSKTTIFLMLLGAALIIFGSIIAAVLGYFSKPEDEEIIRYLDRNYPFTEDSSYLLFQTPQTIFENWQRDKLLDRINNHSSQIKITERFLNKSTYISLLIIGLSGLLYITVPPSDIFRQFEEPVQSTAILSPESDTAQPAILNSEIRISPPGYTNLEESIESIGNFSVPEFSEVEWVIETNQETDSVVVYFNDRSEFILTRSDDHFTGTAEMLNSQIYQLKISGRDSTILSDFYTLSVIDDRPPLFLIHSPAQQRSYVDQQTRSKQLTVQIEDDYGITDANIHATLARGSGENVRFRERSFSFDELTGLNTPTANGQLTLHADSLDMQPGDELYFYITAQDNRPDPQTGRSETYFVIYSDTSRAHQTPFTGMVVDLTPEDLRSQRQVIIDTEELIDEASNLSEERFRDRADRIAQDQALLRLRYGEFLGLENESGMTAADIPPDTDDHTPEQDHGHDHDHDDLDEEGFERAQSDIAALAPEDFMHDHGSAEMNTLFGDSPRGYLREALASMWDAERHLRMSDLEQALPFEYRALEFLQLAQQAERRYVRRAGYEGDPIPVDEVRLTKDADNFSDPKHRTDIDFEPGPLTDLQYLIRERDSFNSADFEQANQWIQRADLEDSDRLFLMNRLRTIETNGFSEQMQQEILEKLAELIPQIEYDPTPNRRPMLRQPD